MLPLKLASERPAARFHESPSESPSARGPSALARVTQRADLYHVVVEQQGDRWFAYVPALPGRVADGETAEAARAAMHKVITAHLLGPRGVAGRGAWFAGERGVWARQRESPSIGLLRALEAQEFRLFYQPTVDLATGDLVGMEALIRWEHPDRGLIGPRDFIPEAEAAGLAPRIDDWVLDEACRQLQRWRGAESDGQRILLSVNLSRGQFQRPDLARHIVGMLQANGLEPSRLRVEVPEAAAIEEVEAAAHQFAALRAAGVHLALDDVSAERSSLAQMRALTVDGLKVDRLLVNQLLEDSRARVLVEAITLLAHMWGMTVTAEGVETAEQAAALRALGCDSAQGFYYGRPVPGEEAELLFL